MLRNFSVRLEGKYRACKSTTTVVLAWLSQGEVQHGRASTMVGLGSYVD